MAGTDRSRESLPARGPVVILVEPQLGENIGMVARAMLNCGLRDLRLVRPRDGWPNVAADNAASGAVAVIRDASVYQRTQEAVADLHRLYVSTARARGMVKPVLTPRYAGAEMRAAEAAGQKVGLLFGPERTGLSNDDVALGDAIISVPLNPAFSSLNLAQAVLLLAYEWYQADAQDAGWQLPTGASRPATKAELLAFLERLEAVLYDMGYFHPPEMAPAMRRNLRNLFDRAQPTEQEVRTLHGVVSALLGAKLKRAPGRHPSDMG